MTGRFFETLRTYDGEPALLDRHLERLAAAVPGIELDPLRAKVSDSLIGEAEDVVIRIEASGGELTVEIRPLPDHSLGDPAAPFAAVIREARGYSYPHKSSDRELHDQLIELAESAGAFEPLIVDDDLVIESARCNVFLLAGDELVTPPLGRCLPGVTRAALIEIAPALGLTPAERAIGTNDLARADEVLLTNSAIGVRRIGSIDGALVGGREPDLLARIQAALLDHYKAAR